MRGLNKNAGLPPPTLERQTQSPLHRIVTVPCTSCPFASFLIYTPANSECMKACHNSSCLYSKERNISIAKYERLKVNLTFNLSHISLHHTKNSTVLYFTLWSHTLSKPEFNKVPGFTKNIKRDRQTKRRAKCRNYLASSFLSWFWCSGASAHQTLWGLESLHSCLDLSEYPYSYF